MLKTSREFYNLESLWNTEFLNLNENQKHTANKVKEKYNKKFSGKIVTKLSLAKNYCPAEEYHQKYLEKI